MRLLFLLLFAGWSADVAAPPAPITPPRAATSAPTIAPSRPVTGSISGRVDLAPRPARRAPRRYPTRGAAPAVAEVQQIPAVVYLKGNVAGGRAAPAPTMAQQDSAFVPAIQIVPVGTAVEFPNRDPFFHNVFSYSGAKRFDLGRYPQGQSKSVTFDEPGVVKIYCEVHEHMRAAVVVIENAHHAVVGENGTFRLEGVPAGRHTLVLWHVDQGEVEREVTVPEGGNVQVELSFR